ncbi:Serine/threonine protein kinase [hydrothermal vent metagenome]|uniref:non-specific serine/threonine protein kinase n=1 Tax=hydrothermal vent metagenome TaxID=652676 RepID=A0A3B0WWQ6_9ZZZZ
MELRNNTNELAEGYLLHWYAIKSVIGRGGFGITYLAHDNNLDRSVAIKEFMPEDFAMRSESSKVLPKPGKKEKLYKWGLRRFVDEARTLAKFNHPNIVRVLSVFEENNTAYMVMEYAQGQDLSFVFKKDKKFTEENFLDTYIPIMDGLSLVHEAGFIHRDIKPANIYLCDNNAPLLLDFGSARQSMSETSKPLTSLVTFGYAPFEQYNEGTGKEGPWTDIYSLGASIYFGITGKKPVDALARGGSFLDNGVDTYKPLSIIAKGNFSDNFLLAVDNAMMFKIEERPSNIMFWADMLLGKVDAPQLPDYMLNARVLEDATVVLPWSTSNTTQHTVMSKSSQRKLIDVHGKRQTAKSGSGTSKKSRSDTILLDSLNEISKTSSSGSSNSNKIWLPVLLVASVVLSVVVAYFSGAFNSVEHLAVQPVGMPVDSDDDYQRQLLSQETKIRKTNPSQIARKRKLASLISNAKREFAKGNFATGNEDSAYYYYTKALEMDEKNQLAKDGIYNIENELHALANKAYEKNEFKKSRVYLAQLNFMNSNTEEGAIIQEKIALGQAKKIKQQKQRKAQIKAWLEQASVHKKNKRYLFPKNKNAFELYQKVLEIDSENKLAKNGIDNIQQYYIILFNAHLASAQLKNAEKDLKAMRKISVASPILKGMQETLNSYKKKKLAKAAVKKSKAPKRIVVKSINISDASKKVALFKAALQERNKRKIKDLSVFVSGREQFVDQLIQQYRRYAIQVTGLRLIPTDNEVLANIQLADLVDINGNKVIPGNWSRFKIVVRYNKKNDLSVYW